MKCKFFQSAVSFILVAAYLVSFPSLIFASAGYNQQSKLFSVIQPKTEIKVSVVEFTSDRFVFSFSKQDGKIGNAQFTRSKDGHKTVFKDKFNEEFALTVKPNANQDKSLITLEYGEISTTINFAQFRGISKLSAKQQEKIETIISKTRSNENFSRGCQKFCVNECNSAKLILSGNIMAN